MSISAVQSAKASALTLAFGSGVTSGNLLIVAFGENTATVANVADTLGTTYTKMQGLSVSSNEAYLWFGIAPSSGGNTVTITSPAATSPVLFVAEFSGISGTLDTFVTNNQYNNLRASTSTDSEMVFTFIAGNHNLQTFTSSATTILQTISSAGVDSGAIGYQNAPTAGVQAIDLASAVVQTDNVVIIASFAPLGNFTSSRSAMRQSAFGPSATPKVAAFGIPVVSGNLIIVGFGNNTAGTPTISDTLGTTYTYLGASSSGGNHGHFWYGVLSSSGANTVTVAGSWSFPNLVIGELSSTGALDVSITSAAASGYTVTTTQDFDALVTVICSNHTNSFTVASGCLLASHTSVDDTGGLAYQNGGAAGSQTSGLSGASTDNGAFFVAFKTVATGGTGIGGGGGGGAVIAAIVNSYRQRRV